jgi:hypothetical protein
MAGVSPLLLRACLTTYQLFADIKSWQRQVVLQTSHQMARVRIFQVKPPALKSENIGSMPQRAALASQVNAD